MISPEIKRNIYRIIPFGIIWLFFSIIYSLLQWGFLNNITGNPSTESPYLLGGTFFITAGIALVSGFLMGTLEVLYFSKLFLETGFAKKIVYKTIVYAVIIISFLLITAAIYIYIDFHPGVFSRQLWNNVWAFFLSYNFLSLELYIASIIGVSLFFMEVSESLGQGVLANFFLGKYYTPIEEERIFMFLDMKSSTTIAESLGHVRYFEMLKEYYADFSGPIIKYSGVIYQYVGDEIIVSWKVKNGLKNNNCIHCFFDMKEVISKQARKYRKRFGLLPEFKAALHLGKVTTGEIGVIKKEIIFTGDVLNTTGRIQGLCNDYQVYIIISVDLVKRLDLNAEFQVESLGENELRGRDEKIELYTIRPI